MIYQEICGCIHDGDKVYPPGCDITNASMEIIEFAKNWSQEQIASHGATKAIQQGLQQEVETERQRMFADCDTHAMMYQREIRLGFAGAAEKQAAWDAYAEALRAINDTPGWYLDPQWPTPPEA